MRINRAKVLEAAQKYQRKGALDKATREYQKLVEDDPSDVRAQLKVADLYAKQSKAREASRAYRAVAYYYLNDDIYDKAAAVFKQAIRLAADEPDLHRDLGEAYHRMGRLKEAMASLHRAQKLYEQGADHDALGDVLERMVRLEPDEPALRIKLAEHYARSGRRDEAIALFGQAGDQFEAVGRSSDYLKVAERVLYLNPSDHALRMRVARQHASLGEDKKALKHLQVLFHERPTDLETLDLLGGTFERIGKPDKALLVRRELARLYKVRGDTRSALKAYERVLALDPSDLEARRALARRARAEPAQTRIPDSPAAPASAFSDRAETRQNIVVLDEELEDVFGAPSADTAQSDDLIAFAADAIEDLGEVEFDALASYPGAPVGPSERLLSEETAESEPARSVDLMTALDEVDVFIKYNLRGKAIAALRAMIERFPETEEPRERLASFYISIDEPILAADQYIELARSARDDERRANLYLERAGELFGDPERVEAIATSIGITMGPAPEVLEGMEESGVSGVGGDSIEVSVGEVFAAPSEPAPAADEFGLDELFSSLEPAADEPADAPLGTIEVAADAIVEVLEGDEGGAFQFEGVEIEEISAPVILEEIDPPPREGEDTSEIEPLDDEEIIELEPERAPADGLGVFLSAEEADGMFDELFADASASLVNVSLGGSKDLEGIADLDFLIDQGMFEEASEVLEELEQQEPASQTLVRRRLSLDLVTELNPGPAPPLAPRAPNAYTILEPSEGQVNTHFELGVAYLEMGLLAEAIDELHQATDDPDVAAEAHYNIAVAEAKRSNWDAARQARSEALAQPSVSARVREAFDALSVRIKS